MILSDQSSRADRWVGHLCFYREIPGIRLIVSILAVHDQDGRLIVNMRVLAAAYRRQPLTAQVGQDILVSCLREGGWNQLWMLYPITATDLEGALQEVAETHPSSSEWGWVTAESGPREE
jgi:hypothetical protein